MYVRRRLVSIEKMARVCGRVWGVAIQQHVPLGDILTKCQRGVVGVGEEVYRRDVLYDFHEVVVAPRGHKVEGRIHRGWSMNLPATCTA